jgi:MoaA/NifB/PqqE/SkfB family radical SAM enzyme
MKTDLEYGDIYNLADDLSIPISVTIELCTVCNLQCKHCYIPSHNTFGLSKQEILAVFDQLRKLGTFEIVFTGGEPFCRDDFMDILETARRIGFHVILFTNATMITKEIAKKLGNLYLYMVSTSIYSMDKKIHDTITGIQGSLEKTLDGLFLLKKYAVPVEVKMMIMQNNLESIEGIYSYCQESSFGCVVSPFLFPRSDCNLNPVF